MLFTELLISVFQTLQDLFSVSDTFQNDIITSVIALFVVIDPIGNIPLFIAFTKKLEKAEHKTVSKTAIITAAALLLLFGVAGTQILGLFGITIFSFTDSWRHLIIYNCNRIIDIWRMEICKQS